MERGSLLIHSWVPANSGAQSPTEPPREPSQGGGGVAVGGTPVAVGPGIIVGSGRAVGSLPQAMAMASIAAANIKTSRII